MARRAAAWSFLAVAVVSALGTDASAADLPRLRRLAALDDDDFYDDRGCDVDEIQLASDGTIARGGLLVGEQVTPNMTVNGTVLPDEYRYFHVCIVRHEHEHAVTVDLHVDTEDANLYLSSEHRHPRMGRSTWIAQRPGDDRLRLYTYLDGFPRKSNAASRTIPLHIAVFGAGDGPATFELSLALEDLPMSSDIESREQYYSRIHAQDRQQRLRWR